MASAVLGTIAVKLRADSAQLVKGMKSASARIKAVQGDLVAMGAGLAATSAALTLIGRSAVTAFSDFQASASKTASLSTKAGDDFNAVFASMSEAAKKLGRETEFSAKQAADGMGFMAMAGFTASETIGAMPSVLQLASAGALDLAQAADITTNILSGMGLAVADLGMANDVLVNTFTNTNTDLVQLGQAFKFVGPVAKATGVSLNETAAAIGLLGNVGIQGTMAGTALRGAISKLLNPSSEAAARLRELGVNAKNSNGEFVGFVSVIRQLEDAGAGAADMLEIFGDRAGPALTALVQTGADSLEAMVEKTKMVGTAAALQERKLATFAGQMDLLRSKAEGAQITLGEALVPAVRLLTGAVSAALDAFNNLGPGMQKTIAIGGAVAAAVTGIGGALALLTAAIPSIVAGVGLLGAGFAALSGGLAAAAVAAGGLIVALAPILIPLAAITGAIIGIKMAFDDASEAAKNLQSARDALFSGFDDEIELKINAAFDAKIKADEKEKGRSVNLLAKSGFLQRIKEQDDKRVEAAKKRAARIVALAKKRDEAEKKLLEVLTARAKAVQSATKSSEAGLLAVGKSLAAAREKQAKPAFRARLGRGGAAGEAAAKGVASGDVTGATTDLEVRASDAAISVGASMGNAAAKFGNKMTQSSGDLGGLINDTVEGFKSGGFMGAIGGFFGNLISRSASFKKQMGRGQEVFGKLVEAIDPLVEAIEPITEIANVLLEGFADQLKPAFEALTPVINALFHAIKFVAITLLNIIRGIGMFWNHLITMVSIIPRLIGKGMRAIGFTAAGDKMIAFANTIDKAKINLNGLDRTIGKLHKTTIKSAHDTMDRFAEKTNDAADASAKAADALLNVPDAFKVALRRFQVTTGAAVDTRTLDGLGGTPTNDVKNITLVGLDPQDLWRQLQELDQGARFISEGTTVGAASRFAVASEGS